ncbi:peptidoglycan DD-metalloendopeptidase family protein [Pseudomonas syringae]|uniref:peptidoglycan DD-metalloendopeptidase family protein n=1 Tax=Pseudomonas syringae TaxID=317 RepID=UPI0013C345F4|nr:peptidoglycan DD-metalloendopeptidase family protein [Pseudomonas syringae]
MELYNPGASFRYTSEWNPTRTHPVSGEVRPHRGEDWGAPVGTSIPAAGAGKVVYKGVMAGYGNLVVLEHANGTEIVHTLYAHMSAPSPLALGASVAKGATVGPCGNTGIGTGAHLHFEVLRNGTKGQPNLARGHATVDPRGFDISNLANPDGVSPAAPAPAETVAASGTWQFPIRKAGGAQYKDAEELFAVLEKETSGHYLLGSHKFWHGGIHISDQSSPQCVREEPVRCMGNGVVVAYRLNKDYLTSEFAGPEATQSLKYSNSFCLVRHDYKSPANTEVQPGTSNELTFYSLYMHLLPFDRYPVSQDEIPAPRIKMIASGFRARSDIKGAPDCQEYGAISAGAEIEILEEHADRVHAKGKLIKGAVGGRTEGQEFWFAYKQNGTSYPKSDGTPSWQEVVPPERTKPGYWKGKVRAVVTASGLTLRHPPATLTHGAAAGQPISAATTQSSNQGLVLCTNSTIEFDSAKVLNLKIGTKTLRMAECTFIPSTSGPTTGLKGHSLPVPSSFWACVEDVSPNRFVQWQALTPTVFDVVVPMETAIKAGDPIGYLGLNENIAGPTGGVSSKHQVHVEVFSADPRIEDFLKNKAGVKEGKQYIYLTADTKLNKKAPETGQTDLKKEHVVDLAKATPFKDTVEWYEVSVLDEAVTKMGLIKKSEAKFISQHDLEKLGFRIVKEENANADGFLDPDDMPAFFKELYTSLDKLGNSDGKVTSDDLTQALKNSELRDQWSKLVAYHPTEWKDSADSPKWARLPDLLKDSPNVLEHEKKRIDSLVFWKDIRAQSAPFNEGVLWHFHPVALISNLSNKAEYIDLERFVTMYSEQHVSFQPETPAFSEKSRKNLIEIVKSINAYVEKNQIVLTRFELAYMFATARHEAYNFRAREFFSSAPEIGQVSYFNKYDSVLADTPERRATALRLENTDRGDGYKFRGRGLVHLTWKKNYRLAGEYFGLDFVSSPDLAAEFENSVPIMIWGMTTGVFTGMKIGSYVYNGHTDYAGARRVINGTDKKDLIASYALKFENILKVTSIAPENK